MKTRRFRVLFIDDSERVVQKLPGRIPDPNSLRFEREKWEIDIVCVHVTLEKSPAGDWVFSGETVQKLAEAFALPVDLICADYGYIDERVKGELREQDALARKAVEEGRPPVEVVRRGKYQTFSTLIDHVAALCRDGRIPPAQAEALRTSFLQFRGRICIYTYIGEAWQQEIGRVQDRAVHVRSQLPAADVFTIDTRDEFYGGGKYEKQHEPDFYAYLVLGWLNLVVFRELQSLVLRRANRLKYIRTKNSVKAAAVALSLGAAVGTMGDWLAATVLGLFRNGQFDLGFAVVGLSIVVILVIGLLTPSLIEKLLTNLFGREDD